MYVFTHTEEEGTVTKCALVIACSVKLLWRLSRWKFYKFYIAPKHVPHCTSSQPWFNIKLFTLNIVSSLTSRGRLKCCYVEILFINFSKRFPHSSDKRLQVSNRLKMNGLIYIIYESKRRKIARYRMPIIIIISN